MAKNKIITSQGNVQFINSKGKTISMHPMHCYAVYQDDTVSFLFIYMKEYSGQAFFASQFEDLEVDGETYDSIDALKEAIAEAFAKAGAQARTEIVDELPETGYTNTIYLLPKEHGEGYDEYIYNENEGWQLIGDTDIEFERYLEKVVFNAYSADTKEKIDFISGAVDDNASDIQFISGAVDTEISNREAADAVISGAVDTLSTNLANEVSRAQNAESALQNNINTVNSRVDAEQIARANADNAISGAVDSVVSDLASEVSRATAKENEIDSKVDGEISAREAADSVISGAVDNVSANLSLEVQRAQNAESALDSKVNALSGESVTSGEVESMIDEAVSGKQDTLIAGENITIIDNVISATGGGDIDSGAVETMIEDYMTDTNYLASSAVSTSYSYDSGEDGVLVVGTSGDTRWRRENNELLLSYDSVGSQGYVVPSNKTWSFSDKELFIQGSLKGSSDFLKYLKNVYGLDSNQIAGESYIMLALKAEYASAITSVYKSENKDIWYGFNEIPTLPKPLTEIEGIVKGSSYKSQCTTYSNVSGSTYLVMNPLKNTNEDIRSLGISNPLDFSGIDFSDDMTRYHISLNGADEGVTTIGFYLALVELYGTSGEYVVLPLDNASGSAWNNNRYFGVNYKPLAYSFRMNKDYDGTNMTDLYSKVSSAQTTANSGLSVANQALNAANTNKSHIVQVDWNQNNSGSTKFDYIKNRPMWKEKAYSDKIYESDPIMSFSLNNYEVVLDSPLVVGDTVKVGYKSRYDTSTGQTMFTDTIKANSGNVPQGSYYCGSYDPVSSWSSKWMWSNDLQTWYVTDQMFDYESTLFVIKASDVYHKLDSNYIGDDIQRTLVSGTNIKTINNESLLGSGNIDIQGGGSSYTAGDGIDITNDVISVTGKADTSAVTEVSDALTAHTADTTVHVTAAEKTSWNGAVTNASNAVTALGGLSLVKLTQAEYDALATKDSNTLYIISD